MSILAVIINIEMDCFHFVVLRVVSLEYITNFEPCRSNNGDKEAKKETDFGGNKV